MMLIKIRTSIILLFLLSLLTGIGYPFAVTGLAQWLFPFEANGSLIQEGQGSILIGQNFTEDRYFWDRGSHSASGVDPDISPQAACEQAARVAKVRQIPDQEIQALIKKNTQKRSLGILGEPRVNVLNLNNELDKL